jgi:hypothetical protein
VSLSAMRCAFDVSRLPPPCFIAIQDLTRSSPCVRIFRSIAWYPVFLRHEIHRHLARQVGGCGVFSSRSASTWPTPTQGSSVFAAATSFGDRPSPSSVVSMSRPRRKRRKIGVLLPLVLVYRAFALLHRHRYFSRSFWELVDSCAGTRHGAGVAALSTHCGRA